MGKLLKNYGYVVILLKHAIKYTTLDILMKYTVKVAIYYKNNLFSKQIILKHQGWREEQWIQANVFKAYAPI